MIVCVLACVASLVVNIHGNEISEEPKSVCSLPIEIGFCRGAIPAYGYDPEEGCIEFSYGGCDGNDNNFKTLDECKAVCENT